MPKAKVTEEHIREAAYHIWKKEGEPHGQDQDFWFRAEAELATPAKPARKAPAKKPAAKAAGAAKPAAAAKTAAPKAPAAKKPAARKTAAKPKAGDTPAS